MEQKYWSCVGRYGLNKLEACQLDKYFNGLWLNSVPVKITFESYEAAEESGFLYGWKEKKQSDQVGFSSFPYCFYIHAKRGLAGPSRLIYTAADLVEHHN
jgi:hypothetical protein